jgi:hypothetical protein
MGKIIFKYLWHGNKIDPNMKTGMSQESHALYEFKQANSISLLEKCPLVSGDVTIEVELSDMGFDLLANLPNEKTKQIFADSLRYRELSEQLAGYVSTIGYANFEKRYDLRSIGSNAIRLIEQFKPSQHFVDHHYRDISVAEIKHTLNQEIAAIINMKERDSQSRKNSALRSAVKNLISDIENFKNRIDHIELAEEAI